MTNTLDRDEAIGALQSSTSAFAEMLRLPLSEFDGVRSPTGPVAFGAFLSFAAWVLATSILLMLRIDWQLTLLALLPLPLVSFSVRHFGRRIHDLTEEAQAKLADLSARKPRSRTQPSHSAIPG